MTVDLEALRAHVGPGPSDEVLQAALDAALEALVNRYGPADEGEVREYLRPFGQWVKLGRRAVAVDSVIEGNTTVAETGYELWSGGRFVRRLASERPSRWAGMVDITYEPFSEDAERDRIVIALCDLELNRAPGLTGITVGPWSEQYNQQADDYERIREAILSSLRPPRAGTW